ncbi:MAG: hypothetical protein U5K70_05835 [Halodesulfurarchaeum sp.]|nr:hypothetical protein [Halodesulfurarchaeum sp.]
MADLPDDLDKEDIDEEALREFFAEQASQDTLIRDVLAQAKKNQWVEESLLQEHPEIAVDLVQTIMLISLVSDKEIDYYLENKDRCSEICDMVVSDFDNGEVSEELKSIYEENAEPVLEKIDELIEDRKREIYGEKYQEMQDIQASDRDNKDEILERIKQPFKEDPANEDLWTEINLLGKDRKRVKSFPYSQSDVEEGTGAISGDERAKEKHYAVQIWNPELYTTVYSSEKEYDEFPLKWLTHLPIHQDRLLYREWQDTGEVPEEYLINEVQSEGYLDNLFSETQKVPFFQKREGIIKEVISNYRDERYASVINLILPQIESFVWIYAAYLQEHKNEEILLNADFDHFWNFNPRDYDDLSLKNTSGNEIKSPNVKDLISETVVQNYLNEDMTEYFVDELFVERNPILHGNVANYHSEVEASKKIIFFNNLLDRVTKEITEDFAEEVKESVDFDADITDFASQSEDS